MSEYNKYFLLYLTTNAQSRLELTDNYIQTYNYSIDEATTKAEGRCWHYVKLIENENSYILVRHDEIKIVKVKFVTEEESTYVNESSKYSLIYLTREAQIRLELSEDYIYALEYPIDEETTQAEGRCWHYIQLLNDRNAYILVRHDEIKQIQFIDTTYSYQTDSYNELPSYSYSSNSCFIATACSANFDELNSLYNFRDKYLMNFSLGKKFIDFYYAFSPPIANVIRDSTVLKLLTRYLFIKPIVLLLDLFLLSKRI
jgi:hypothetical protein